MHGPRILWWTGLAVLLIGAAYGIYHGQTAEGLAALGGIIILLMALAAGSLVMAAASFWSSRSPPPLPGAMLAIATLGTVATLGIGLLLLNDIGLTRFPGALLLAGGLALAGCILGWRAYAQPSPSGNG